MNPINHKMRALCVLFLLAIGAAAKQKNGKAAQFLEDNHSAMVCVANIAEELMPEMPQYMMCCGFWNARNFFMHKVENECEPSAVERLQDVSRKVSAYQEEHCSNYPPGSLVCRMLIIVPILTVVSLILLLVAFCICANYSFIKWRSTQKKYRKLAGEELPSRKHAAENRMLAADSAPGKASLLAPGRPTQPNDYDQIRPATFAQKA